MATKGEGVTVHFMYDICCLFKSHLKVTMETLLLASSMKGNG